jgi:hypothetical protein
MECLPRLIVIAGYRKEKNISVPSAAYALASEGYLIGPTALRGVLESCLQEIYSGVMEPIKWKRPFLDLRNQVPPDEQRQRLHRSEQKKYTHLDPAIRALIEHFQLQLLGLASASGESALDQMLSLFSYERCFQSVRQASDDDIRQAFQDAGEAISQLIPKGLPLLSLIFTAGLGDAMTKDPPEWAHLQKQLAELARLFSGEDPDALSRKVRIPTTLMVLNVRVQHITNLSELAGVAFRVVLTNILQNTGEVGDSIRAALQKSIGNDDEEAREEATPQ